MSNPVGNILRAATRKSGEPLNILTFPTHERYQSSLALCNANFYLLRGQGIKDWNQQYAPLPSNHILLNPERGERQIPAEVNIDLMLCQSVGHFQTGEPLSRKLHLPIIRLEHTLPFTQWSPPQLEYFRQMKGHLMVTVSEFNRKQWGFPETTRIIHHGIDTDFWTPGEPGPFVLVDSMVERKPQVLSVVNDFVNRDWCCGYSIWKETVKDLPFKLVGDTPGLSKPAKDMNELRQFYRESAVFLNTTLISSAPVSPLEAMACGCAVVSTSTTTMPDVIQHGVNGFLGETPEQLAELCRMLLNDVTLCRKVGEAARQTVVDRFSNPRFVREWDAIFREAANITYTGQV